MGAVAEKLDFGDRVRNLMRSMADLPQVECPLRHHFSPGVYVREIFMPAGSVIVGKVHKTEHLNILQSGHVLIATPDGPPIELVGPVTFVSKAGVQKTLYILSDTTWSTVHVTDLRDLEQLEAALIEPGDYPAFDRSEERQAISNAAAAEYLQLAVTTETEKEPCLG
jgi:hypothetical protein